MQFNNQKRYLNKLRKVLLVVFLFLILPFAFGALALTSNILSERYHASASDYETRKIYIISEKLSKYSRNIFRLYSKIPVIEGGYAKTYEFSNLLHKISRLSMARAKLREGMATIFRDIFTERDEDIEKVILEMDLDIDVVYQDINFMMTDIYYPGSIGSRILGMITNEEKLTIMQEQVLKMEKISKNLLFLLGFESPQSYLILVQNNSNITSSGGTIEAVGIITITSGKIISEEFYSSNDLNENIQGVVSPPTVLTKYANLDSWDIQRAYWDIDFMKSTEKMEWFLDKALDKHIDGVIVLDVNALGDILELVGDVRLGDVKLEKKYINSIAGSFSEMDSVHKVGIEDVFEGIYKAFKQSDKDKKEEFLGLLPQYLKRKRIQLFFHNEDIQEILFEYNLSGGVKAGYCGENCYSDFAGVVEDNLGDTSSDLVRREIQLDISFEELLLKRRVIYFLENNNDGKYKTYIRLFSRSDSGFNKVSIVTNKDKKYIDPQLHGSGGHKDAGVFMSIEPDQAVAIIFEYEGGTSFNIKDEGGYSLIWRKQAGVEEMPINININSSFGKRLSVDEDEVTLTNEGSFGYNTSLTQDMILRLFW